MRSFVKEFMEESIKDSNGVLPGKTIFFCAISNMLEESKSYLKSCTQSTMAN
jgi:hypothetical protein